MVATSSLELGIDMGAVDLVVQVGAPPSVASGLQRIGRAGHQVGAVSKGVVFPLFRGDLVPATVIAQRMRAARSSTCTFPPTRSTSWRSRWSRPWPSTTGPRTICSPSSAAPRRSRTSATPPGGPCSTCSPAAIRSEDFAELRARITWDRATGMLRGRPGALRLAATSGGTIPDKGAFGVFLATDAPDGGAPATPSRTR